MSYEQETGWAWLSASMQNDLGFNTLTGKIEQGYPLTRDTDTVQSTFFRRFTWSAWSTTFDSTWDVFIWTTALVSAPNTTSWQNARFYVRWWASVFDNAWVDWNEIVEFRTDRSWSIFQRWVGAAASTQLMSNTTWLKQFKFSDNTNEDIAIIESRWDISQSAFVISKALKLNRQQVLWIVGWTIFAMTDNLVAVDVDTTAWAVTINLTPPWNHIWRHYRIYKYAWTNPITITTPSWWLIHMRWAWSSTSQTFNDLQKYSIILRCDTTNWFVEYSDTIETTRLVTVPSQTRTIVWAAYTANARTTIEWTTAVLIGSFTFTNTKSVPVNVQVLANTLQTYSLTATWNYWYRSIYRVSVWASNYLNNYLRNWWFYVTWLQWQNSTLLNCDTIPVAAWATIQIDFSAWLDFIESSVAWTVSWSVWFDKIRLLVVNQ